jgi:hypothetical protein
MEGGLMMVLHSIMIGILLYLFMFFVLQQKSSMAQDRSILIASIILIYMLLFGHGMPNKINSNII